MSIVDLLQPLLPILGKAISININEVGLAKLILYWLGDRNRDSGSAQFIDEAIEGGVIVEAVDGMAGKAYIKKLREWAEEKIK